MTVGLDSKNKIISSLSLIQPLSSSQSESVSVSRLSFQPPSKAVKLLQNARNSQRTEPLNPCRRTREEEGGR